MTNVVYESRCCLFFDVLGFKNKVSKLDAEDIHDVLLEIRNSHNYRKVYGESASESIFSSRRVTQFSDCVVVSYLNTDPIGWMNIIKDVFRLQLNLIRKGFLIRGGITIGDLYHDDQFCFGPALIEAAELEKRADYPRVILNEKSILRSWFDNPTVSTDLSEGRFINNMVAKDLDNKYFIDYFNVIPNDFDESFNDFFDYLHDLKKQVVELGDAAIKDISLKSKYRWMRNKYDDMTNCISMDNEFMVHGHLVPDAFKDNCSELRIIDEKNSLWKLIRCFYLICIENVGFFPKSYQ